MSQPDPNINPNTIKNAELKTVSKVSYAKLVHELYQGHLPVVIPLGGRIFWAIYDPPKDSRLYTDSQLDRETHITRLTVQTGLAACQLLS